VFDSVHDALPLQSLSTSLSRLVNVSETGQVVYQAEKHACRVLPGLQRDEIEAGVKRNFQVLSPLVILASTDNTHRGTGRT